MGTKVPFPVPTVTPFSAAQSIAGAYTELSETSENGFAMLDEGQSS